MGALSSMSFFAGAPNLYHPQAVGLGIGEPFFCTSARWSFQQGLKPGMSKSYSLCTVRLESLWSTHCLSLMGYKHGHKQEIQFVSPLLIGPGFRDEKNIDGKLPV